MRDPLLTTGQIAVMLGKSPRTIREWVQRGALPLPDFHPSNGHRQWHKSTILEATGKTSGGTRRYPADVPPV